MLQLDGNVSLNSSMNPSENCEDSIPVIVNFRPRKRPSVRSSPVLCPISFTQTAKSKHSLPTLSVYNARSLFPKIASLATDIEERDTDICFVTEIWEQNENKRHRKKIEELLELKGIKYISNPRRNRRGGGAGIAVNLKNFTVSKLNIHIPAEVECVWGLIKPNIPSKSLSSYISCCFYSPPDKYRNAPLIDHVTVTLQNLLTIHRNAGIFICGDRNQVELSSLLAIDPSLE